GSTGSATEILKSEKERDKFVLRRFVFPALLSGNEKVQEDEEEGMERSWAGELFVAGRRAHVLSPLLVPGVFEMVQARLANRYPGCVTLSSNKVMLYLLPIVLPGELNRPRCGSHSPSVASNGGRGKGW
ncbi:unnamed protein product, partial [Choristocarpus tenellus]